MLTEFAEGVLPWSTIGHQPDFPRVLFVTPAAFNKQTGGGITFSNLFLGWPRERLATVHNDRTPVSNEICSKYYELSAAEVGLPAILRRLRGTRPSVPAATGAASEGPSALGRVKRFFVSDALPDQGRLSPQLEAWIAAFRPELLYTPLGSIGMMQLVDRIRRRFHLPLAVHFMDDWQSAIYRGSLLSGLQRRRMQRLIRRLVDTAFLRLGICDAMCSEYAARFGCPFQPFQNTLDTARWQSLTKRDLAVGSPFKLLYAGSILSFAQAESLLDCCAAVAALRRDGLAIEFEIYSPSEQLAPIRPRLPDGTQCRNIITDDETYFRTLAAADILLLPVNFDEHSKRYIRLSMPTKVPSYLVSGTPVLVYGPAGMAQVEYARAAGWGHVVDRQDPAALAAAIKLLASDLQLRHRLSAAARRTASERHDSAVVRAGFQTALAAAGASRP